VQQIINYLNDLLDAMKRRGLAMSSSFPTIF